MKSLRRTKPTQLAKAFSSLRTMEIRCLHCPITIDAYALDDGSIRIPAHLVPNNGGVNDTIRCKGGGTVYASAEDYRSALKAKRRARSIKEARS